MNPTIKAILARCNGDVWEAIKYCDDIARQYPHLRTEYERSIAELILSISPAAAAGGAR